MSISPNFCQFVHLTIGALLCLLVCLYVHNYICASICPPIICFAIHPGTPVSKAFLLNCMNLSGVVKFIKWVCQARQIHNG